MDKRYQVFVSSTFEDLKEERKEVMQALLELDCIPAGMELFPASNDDQWTLIKKVIDDCDYYILIIGGRYGSENQDGISYTQMEFEYALQQKKPIISFLPKNPETILSGKCDNDPLKRDKLEKFKELAKKKLVRYWDSPVDLGSVVSRSMVRLIKDFPAEGWVKSGSIVDETSLKEISRLQKENNELKEQLAAMTTQAPKGTEKLAQGENKVKISFTFVGTDDYGYDDYNCTASLYFTWNELFACIAPCMINESPEYELNDRLCELISKKESKLLRMPQFNKLISLRKFHISKSDFDLIKVQLKALGLICLSIKKRSTNSTQTYWKLTPYGDYMMTQLLAIQKKEQE